MAPLTFIPALALGLLAEHFSLLAIAEQPVMSRKSLALEPTLVRQALLDAVKKN